MRDKKVELGNANAPLTANPVCDDGTDGGCHEADSGSCFCIPELHIKLSSIAAAVLIRQLNGVTTDLKLEIT